MCSSDLDDSSTSMSTAKWPHQDTLCITRSGINLNAKEFMTTLWLSLAVWTPPPAQNPLKRPSTDLHTRKPKVARVTGNDGVTLMPISLAVFKPSLPQPEAGTSLEPTRPEPYAFVPYAPITEYYSSSPEPHPRQIIKQSAILDRCPVAPYLDSPIEPSSVIGHDTAHEGVPLNKTAGKGSMDPHHQPTVPVATSAGKELHDEQLFVHTLYKEDCLMLASLYLPLDGIDDRIPIHAGYKNIRSKAHYIRQARLDEWRAVRDWQQAPDYEKTAFAREVLQASRRVDSEINYQSAYIGRRLKGLLGEGDAPGLTAADQATVDKAFWHVRDLQSIRPSMHKPTRHPGGYLGLKQVAVPNEHAALDGVSLPDALFPEGTIHPKHIRVSDATTRLLNQIRSNRVADLEVVWTPVPVSPPYRGKMLSSTSAPLDHQPEDHFI
ncbi:hypothetical protein PG995_006599 [Apiospora arundinis]